MVQLKCIQRFQILKIPHGNQIRALIEWNINYIPCLQIGLQGIGYVVDVFVHIPVPQKFTHHNITVEAVFDPDIALINLPVKLISGIGCIQKDVHIPQL